MFSKEKIYIFMCHSKKKKEKKKETPLCTRHGTWSSVVSGCIMCVCHGTWTCLKKKNLKNMYGHCKLILDWQLLRMHQLFISYQENGIK
jgi:hypothetical protein